MSADPAIVERVLAEARALLGQREQAGANWGPIVELVASPFISAERLATFAPGQKNAGKLMWCALFASYCWWKGWPGFKPYADSECSDLWEKASAKGWTWIRSADSTAPPPGALIFFVNLLPGGAPKMKRGKPDLRHVGIVERVDEGGDVQTLEGNSSDQVRQRRYHLSDPSIWGYAMPSETA